VRSIQLTDSETEPHDIVEDGEEAALPAVTVAALPRIEAGADGEGVVEDATLDDADDDEWEEDVEDVDGLDFCVTTADRVTLSERLGQERSFE
jgi:hypothetical protein